MQLYTPDFTIQWTWHSLHSGRLPLVEQVHVIRRFATSEAGQQARQAATLGCGTPLLLWMYSVVHTPLSEPCAPPVHPLKTTAQAGRGQALPWWEECFAVGFVSHSPRAAQDIFVPLEAPCTTAAWHVLCAWTCPCGRYSLNSHSPPTFPWLRINPASFFIGVTLSITHSFYPLTLSHHVYIACHLC